MLADEICADGYFCLSPTETLMRAIETITHAGRFVVDREILVAADFISQSMPSSLLRGLPLCRLPFPAVWFEYAGHDLPGIVDRAGIVVPHRAGLLCESDPNAPYRVVVNLFWWHKTPGGRPQLSPVAMVLDLSSAGDRGQAMEDGSAGSDGSVGEIKDWLLRSDLPRNRVIAGNPDELSAAVSLSNLCRFELSHYLELDRPDFVEAEAERAVTRIADRLRGPPQERIPSDAGILLGILMLLNTHNGTRQQTASLDKLNRARAKRRLPQLLGYSTVTLHLAGRRAETRRWGSSGEAVREHLVRGHFKIRKSGIFWWLPHSRGQPNLGKVDKTYKLTV
jgi:hypothetical protein